jgi:hypothetical protein
MSQYKNKTASLLIEFQKRVAALIRSHYPEFNFKIQICLCDYYFILKKKSQKV